MAVTDEQTEAKRETVVAQLMQTTKTGKVDCTQERYDALHFVR